MTEVVGCPTPEVVPTPQTQPAPPTLHWYCPGSHTSRWPFNGLEPSSTTASMNPFGEGSSAAAAAAAVTPAPIFDEASKTKQRLRQLCDDVATKTASYTLADGVEADHGYLTDCLDRFRIWAGSLGVFQTGDASLDARLSNHFLAGEVLRLLRQLDTVTSDREFLLFYCISCVRRRD